MIFSDQRISPRRMLITSIVKVNPRSSIMLNKNTCVISYICKNFLTNSFNLRFYHIFSYLISYSMSIAFDEEKSKHRVYKSHWKIYSYWKVILLRYTRAFMKYKVKSWAEYRYHYLFIHISSRQS